MFQTKGRNWDELPLEEFAICSVPIDITKSRARWSTPYLTGRYTSP